MATSAYPPQGATPANGLTDPFVSPPTYAPRYASLDFDQLSSYSTASPGQAKRALEAHLNDTDRRIQDASRLGSTLIQQRKDLAARLQEVQSVPQDNEVPDDLRRRLTDLEREYNEVGKESARAFLPKAKLDAPGTPSALTGSGRESPTKMTAPSRRSRNQPTSRVHDIEFATEISTSLLAQVRQLQAALSEKDEELKDTTAAKSQLESEALALAQRLKHLDDNEQRYKDENWNLETRLQELEASHKDVTDREMRVAQSLKSTQGEKAAAQRDLDDLKASHEKLNEEHAVVKRQQETDLHGLRRDAASHETEKKSLQKRIEELTSQNTELARAVSYRFNQPGGATDTEFVSAEEGGQLSDGTPDESAPESPIKGTPARHGMLESETLKSSLNHAHRMIQNLKNNIHREKTEKIELKRMLQEARDELETRRSEGSAVVGANVGKKRRSDLQTASGKFSKAGPRALGANRSSTTEIMEDEPDWEDHDGIATPTKSMNMPGTFAASAGAAALGYAAGEHSTGEDPESTDAAFETATERGEPSDAFETGRESMDGDDSDELTETESNNLGQNGRVRKAASGLVGAPAGHRQSFQSTASDDEMLQTPAQSAQQQQKYRLRVNRGSRRDRVSDLIRDSPSGHSPGSSSGTPQRPGQSLGDELDALDEGTPSRYTDSAAGSPATQRAISVGPPTPELNTPLLYPNGGETISAHSSSLDKLTSESDVSKPAYADAGMMTEPWEPESVAQPSSLREKAAEVVGGALAGFGLGKLTGGPQTEHAEPGAEKADSAPAPEDNAMFGDSPTLGEKTASAPRDFATLEKPRPIAFAKSHIVSQETEPVSLPETMEAGKRTTVIPAPIESSNLPAEGDLDFSPVIAQHLEPMTPSAPMLPKRNARRGDDLGVFSDEPVENEEYKSLAIPGTDAARPGAGFFGTTQPAGQQRTVLGEVPSNVQRSAGSDRDRDSMGMMPLVSKRPMSDEGSQTDVSGNDIEDMLRNKNRVSTLPELPLVAGAAAGSASSGRSIDGVSNEAAPLRAPRRPTSSSSLRNRLNTGSAPPLPEDHTLKIAQAQKAPTTPGAAAVGSMGPPLMPASAYKQGRPRTPADSGRAYSRDGTTPRAKQVQSPTGTTNSRRTSLSSFASEVDERINGRAQFMYPEGVQPATDPRMIQAITQTMIGEYLWKYTRKAGRSDTSNTRHRRFFWVHPYTRTLYWSEKDPSTAGRDMLKAKSVAIESVRVVSDDNTYPPGLHRKSLVVVTPGREIVFTAPTGQRHETWFNALSYLLLRTEQERGEAEGGINQEDIDEFNPGIGSSFRRSISRMTGRSHSRASLSSYNSRTTRTSSPSRGQRQSATGVRSKPPPSPSPVPQESTASRYSTARDTNGGRLSSITSRFMPGSTQRGSYSTNRGRDSGASRRGRQAGSEIYDASVATDSAEDLRAVIQRQEQDADRLENVRACCDGKHDVGSLSRTSRHSSSLGHRFSAHTHTHAHPRTEPIQEL